MITGVVNALLEATIRVPVQDTTGQSYPIEVMIDSGFNGDMTLPPAVINPLGLSWVSQLRGVMADGNVYLFDTYTAIILWDGQPRTVEVQSNDVRPLLGTTLLEGHDLRIEFVTGGRVEIQPRSTP